MLTGEGLWLRSRWSYFPLLLILLTTFQVSDSASEKDENHLEETQSVVNTFVDSSSLQYESFMEDRMNRMETNFQDQIDQLRTKDLFQEKLLREAASEISQLKRRMDRLIKSFSHPYHKKGHGRSSRSIESSASSAPNNITLSDAPAPSSSWSKLQISPEELGSMSYENYGINIYGHSANNLQVDNAKKRYYYSPISLLNHKSANSFFNNITDQYEVRFKVEMWNEELEKEIVKFTSDLVGYSLKQSQIRVLPLEKVMLSSNSHHQTRLPFKLSKDWSNYQRHQSVIFVLTCARMKDCEELASQMQNNPQQFDHFKLLCSLSSQTSQRAEVTIRIENIVNGDLMSKLHQRFPNAPTVLLTAEDEKRLLSESVTNIMVDSIFDDLSVVTPDSEKNVYNMLRNLLVSSTVTIRKQSDKMWDSVFWNEDNYRPDKVVRTLNEVYNKLDTENRKQMVNSFTNQTKNKGGGSLSLWRVLGLGVKTKLESLKSGNVSIDELDRIFKESHETVEWEGEKFVPKPMQLSRINIVGLNDSKVFQERKVKVTYNTAILSINVNIPTNLNQSSVDEVFRIKTKIRSLDGGISKIAARLRRPQCFKPNKTPSSCQDLHCIGHTLNGYYYIKGRNSHKMEMVYCAFDKFISNKLYVPGLETRIGFSDIKSSSDGVHFYVQRDSSFTTPNAVIPFQVEQLNIGGAMDLVKGEFTAPHTGIYHFSFTGIKDVSAITLNIQLRLQDFKTKGIKIISTATGGDRNGFFTLALDSTLKLNAGDRITLFKSGNGVLKDDGNRYTHFTGRLLEEDLSLL